MAELPVDARPLVLAPDLLVVLRTDGLHVQRPPLAHPLVLDLAGLHVLAHLQVHPAPHPAAAVRDATARIGHEAVGLRSLVFDLRHSGNLGPGDPWSHPEAPDHPRAASAPPVDLDAPDLVTVRLPLTLRLRAGRYEILDSEGFRWLALDPVETHFLRALTPPVTARGAVELAAAHPGGALAEDRAAAILGWLHGAGLLRRGAAPSEEHQREGTEAPVAEVLATRQRTVFERHFHDQNRREDERRAATGVARTPVVPVAFDDGAPAGLGMVVAHLNAYDGGRLHESYEIRTDWVWDDAHLGRFTERPAVFLFSNYLWSHARCLEVSRRVKALSPASITVHGGPDTPKYADDLEGYFRDHPHVDVAVRGEGEVTTAELLTALAPMLGTPDPDLSVLAEVAGLTYLGPGGPVRTADRPRIADLADLPSPYLDGLFDVYAEAAAVMVTLETNRGCPYGCTFCDWGSATTSRVRHFPTERVRAELEWCARNQVIFIGLADANYGMFARDVEFAELVADLRTRTGHPRGFGVSYAKNTVKHLARIIEVLSEAGVVSQGVLSLQTMDAGTLRVIHRSNIRTERYDELATQMRGANLPLLVELMMGLPGQTVDSFTDDLQQCIDREVRTRINQTTLLVNSPMNEAAYRAEHQIATAQPLRPGQATLVTASDTFTPADWAAMNRLRLHHGLFEDFGVFRLVSRYVRQATGIREADLYRHLPARVLEHGTRWPALAATVVHGSSVMAPVYSWALVFDDLRRHLAAEYGLGGSGLDAVLTAQRAILPAPGRTFPATVELPHDVVAWYRDILRAKGSGHRADWTSVVAPLESFGPAPLTVADPDGVSDHLLGVKLETSAVGASWELESPLSRAHVAHEEMTQWYDDHFDAPSGGDGSVPVQLGSPRSTSGPVLDR
jgi:hypothetical protein